MRNALPPSAFAEMAMRSKAKEWQMRGYKRKDSAEQGVELLHCLGLYPASNRSENSTFKIALMQINFTATYIALHNN